MRGVGIFEMGHLNLSTYYSNCWFQFWSNKRNWVKQKDGQRKIKTTLVLLGCIDWFYNKSMGGTDQMNQGISAYWPFVCNMKWYWPVFLYCFEVSLYNAWLFRGRNKTNLYCQLKLRVNTNRSGGGLKGGGGGPKIVRL